MCCRRSIKQILKKMRLVVMDKLFQPSHHLSESCHCHLHSDIGYLLQVKFQLNRTLNVFLPMEMDRRASNNCSSATGRSLAIPLFCHCQFVLLFDMHVICIMHIWSTALIFSPPPPPFPRLSLAPCFLDIPPLTDVIS